MVVDKYLVEILFVLGAWLTGYSLVIRTEGLLFIPSGRSWRPVVCLDVDGVQSHELTLCCDGQNRNTKIPFTLHNVDHQSKLGIKILHQSHKHRKKQHLIASESVLLSGLADEPGSKINVRLSCTIPRSPTIRFVGGRQQRHVGLVVTLRAPTHPFPISPMKETYPSESDDDTLIELPSPTGASDKADNELSPEQSHHPPSNGVRRGNRRRRRLRRRDRQIRGCVIDANAEDVVFVSNDFALDVTPDSVYTVQRQPPSAPPYDVSEPITDTIRNSWGDRVSTLRERISSFSEKISSLGVNLSSLGERTLHRLTPYTELHGTQQDRFDEVLPRLRNEWYAAAASLIALGGIDAAVFGLAPGSIFPVDGFARRIVALGAISSGLGLLHNSALLLSYGNIDGERFRTIAQDADGTYFSFCLRCRVPAACLLVSAMCLTVFLLTVAWSEWPDAVLALSFLSGVLFSLQYLVNGCSRISIRLRGGQRVVQSAGG